MTPQETVLERFLARLDREPQDVQNAVVHFLPNAVNGCSWAFLSPSSSNFKEEQKLFEESTFVDYYPLANGAMISTSLEKVMQTLSRVAPEVYTTKDKNIALTARKKSVESFVSFLRSGVRKARIGIFNLNDSSNISISGTVYKAFNIDLATAAMFLRDAGYHFLVDGRPLPAEYVLNEERYPMVLARLETAPSGNGLMVDIVKVPKK